MNHLNLFYHHPINFLHLLLNTSKRVIFVIYFTEQSTCILIEQPSKDSILRKQTFNSDSLTSIHISTRSNQLMRNLFHSFNVFKFFSSE